MPQNDNVTLRGKIDLTNGTRPEALQVEAKNPRTGAIIATGQVDQDGRFSVDVPRHAHPAADAADKFELAKRHHGVGHLFGLHALEKRFLDTVTRDLLPGAGKASLAVLELKDEVAKVRHSVADFVTRAPFFAASADGRPLSPDHANLEFHIRHADDRGESAQRHGLLITGDQNDIDLGDIAPVSPSHHPDEWHYDPNDDFPRRLWGKQPVDQPNFDLGWTAAYLKVLTQERAPNVDRPYGVLVGNFLKKDELRPYWSFAMDAMTSPPVAVTLDDNNAATGAFPANKTQTLRGDTPFVSDDYVVERLLQGMNPVQFRRCADNPALIEVPFLWDGYERSATYSLNNVTARFSWSGDKGDNPHFDHIEVDGKTYRPSGQVQQWDEWHWARYQFMVSYLLAGESDAHLTRGHTNMEQYLVPMMMHLSEDHPARTLMAPHLRDVWGINNFGNILIFGETGVLAKCSALSNTGVRQRLKDCLGGEDWRDYAPRAPLCDAHHYAHAAGLYWDVVGEHVDAWFDAHWDTARLDERDAWTVECGRFSDDLVAHAVPYVPTWGGGGGWLDTQEFSPATLRDGTPKAGAVSPIADVADLKQVCRYVIFHCTFVHDWTNDRQHDDGGDLMFSALGLRDGQAPADGDWTQWWERAQPAPSETAYTLFLCYFLSTLKWGMLTGKPDMQSAELADKVQHDERAQIQDLVERIQRARPEGSFEDRLAAYGQVLNDIRARINT